jgi:hypothetical protein
MSHREPPPAGNRAAARHREPRTRVRIGRVLALLTSVAVTVVAIVGATQARWADVSGDGTSPDVGVADAPVSPQPVPSPTAQWSDIAESEPGVKPQRPAKPTLTRPQAPVPEHGSGRFTVAPGPSDVVVTGTSYRVEVEQGVPFSTRQFADFVESTLSDPRGWAATGSHTLSRVNGPADVRIVLATPSTTDALCAPLRTRGRLSCRIGRDAVINAWRWMNGASTFADDLPGYRRYVVNHEVGHALGWKHAQCAARGQMAPVMLQQTLGLNGCRANPWPGLVDLVRG